MLFAAATGLQPGEWTALEHRDIDRDAGVVYVRRAYRNGRVKCPKTDASIRAVPLQTIALATLERLGMNGRSPLVFPSPNGSYFDLHNFRNRYWNPLSSRQGSRRNGAFTISGTRSRPLRFVPASRPSSSRVTWEQAWE